VTCSLGPTVGLNVGTLSTVGGERKVFKIPEITLGTGFAAGTLGTKTPIVGSGGGRGVIKEEVGVTLGTAKHNKH